jgi:hypothetical protein
MGRVEREREFEEKGEGMVVEVSELGSEVVE